MVATSPNNRTATPVSRSSAIPRLVAGLIVAPLFFWCFFLAAGDAGWLRGWIYIGIQIAGNTIITLVVARKDPELLRRRATFGKGTKRWDFVVLSIFGLTFLATLLVAAFDVGRGWSTMESPGWWLVGLALFGVYVLILIWSMLVNTFFEKSVRIQTDRDHQVIDTGPYRIVRHPGYLGMIAGLILSAPFLLGSWWAFVPAAVSTANLIVRTVLEDRTLHEELAGYEDYARRVRFRLLPGIW